MRKRLSSQQILPSTDGEKSSKAFVMINRLTHKAHLINMNRISYRLKGARDFNEKSTKQWQLTTIFHTFASDNLGVLFWIIAGSTFRLLYAAFMRLKLKKARYSAKSPKKSSISQSIGVVFAVWLLIKHILSHNRGFWMVKNTHIRAILSSDLDTISDTLS